VVPKQPGLESSRLRCLGCPSADDIRVDIHDNRPAKAGDRTSLSGTNSRSVSLIAPLVGDISQGSVATHLGCGGIFSDMLVQIFS